MDDYLLDRDALGRFVDELMKQKPLDVESPEELNRIREAKMAELDQRVGDAIFGSLSDEQLDQINKLMDADVDSDAYQKFFEDNNVDISKIMEETFRSFGNEFLGGRYDV